MRYVFGEWVFTLNEGGTVRVWRNGKGPVELYPGSVVTYVDLVNFAQGFMAGKEKDGWGSILD